MSFLPGMSPAGAMDSGLTTLSLIASATSTSGTINGPASIKAGDLLAIAGYGSDFGSGAQLPAGFTPASLVSNSSLVREGIAYRIADGSEAGAILAGFSGNLGSENLLCVFRGNVPIKLVIVGSPNSQKAEGDITPQVVSASSGAPPLVVLAYYATDGSVDPRTFTPSKDGEITSQPNFYLAYKIYNSNPVDVIVDMDDEGGQNFMASCYIACSKTQEEPGAQTDES